MEKLMSEINFGSASDGGGVGSFSTFQRRIEFHPARKPFTGFSNSSDESDFKLETLNPSSSDPVKPKSGQDSSGKKADASDFWENGLDPELSFGMTFRRIGAGLENLGNTCFLNSVLQCLTYTEPLAAYLQSGKHQNSCRIAGFCALCAIQKHVSRALQAPGRILAPKDLVLNLRSISRNFRISRQEDAHEYMVNLLESMHKCCIPLGVPSESPSAYDKSLVHKIFGGRLRSQVKCMQCSYCSNKFDPFLDLSLEIIKADSVQKALVNFTAPELLDGGEKQYQCQRCKQKVRALKQLTVHKAPYVLTVHLKRFRSHDPGQKIDKKVHFGRTLDMKSFVSGSNEGDLKYTLYGVLVHHGWSTHSGHYYCFVRTSSGMWYSLDDNRVVQVSEKSVLEQKAYMLFYVRDKRNVAPRKPVDVVQKENVKANVSGNKPFSVLNNPSKDNLKSNPVENKTQGSELSSAARQKGTKEILGSKQTKNEQILREGSVSYRDNVFEPSVKSSGNTDNSEKNNASMTDSSKSNEIGNSNKALGSSSTILSNGVGSQTSADKLATKETSQKINIIPNGGSSRATLSHDSSDVTLKKGSEVALSAASGDKREKMDTVNSPNANSANVQIGDKSAACGDSLNGKTENGSLHVNVLDSESKKKLKKKKKKLRKSQIRNMNVGLKLFKPSLGLCRKKKQKKSKLCALDIRNLSEELLSCKESISSDPGPSKSENVNAVPSSSHFREKAPNGTAHKHAKTCNGVSSVIGIDTVLKERTFQNGAVLATDEPLQDGSKYSERGMLQEGMNMLTRGLEETTIPHWDGIEVQNDTIESNANASISIGYIPDEWDEEYDRGKRKKIRQKRSFDGPNPFQEIAINKSQVKKAKLDRTSSGNQPFRIR